MYQEITTLLHGGGWLTVAAVLLILYCLHTLIQGIRLWRVDVREHRLPRSIVYSMILSTYTALPLVLLMKGDAGAIGRVFLGGAVLWVFYLLMRVLSFGTLGRGDVRLALALGGALAYFSMVNLVWASLVTFIVGGVFSLALVLFGMARSGTRVAFGPFMLLGALTGWVWPAYTLF